MGALLLSSPGLLDGFGSSDLTGAALDDPSTDLSGAAPLPVLAAAATPAIPTPVSLPAAAVLDGGFDSVFFERIHVLPRLKDLGAVGTEQELTVEVWNADRYRSKTLQEITVTGSAGAEVDDDLGQPAEFPATYAHLYTIRVLAEGDPFIDTDFVFVFVGVDPAGTTLEVLGFRILIFPFEPNMDEPYEEEIAYLTDVLESFSGMEQRIKLREVPNGSILYSTVLGATRDADPSVRARQAQLLQAMLYGNQARGWGVGRWWARTPLTAGAAAGETELLCDTAELPFEVGGLAYVQTGPFQGEAHVIEDVQADRVVLSLPLVSGWPAGADVMPMVIGRLGQEETLSWESLLVGSTSFTFTVDRYRP